MHFVLFGCIWDSLLHYNTQFKTGQTGAKVCDLKSFRNFSQQTNRSTPLHPNLMFLCVSYYLGAFGTVCCITTLSSKWDKLVQKFVPRSRVRIFRNERTRSTPLDSKLMFRCVLYYFGPLGTIWLPYKTLWKIGRTSAIVHATKSRRIFLQRTHPIHPVGP